MITALRLKQINSGIRSAFIIRSCSSTTRVCQKVNTNQIQQETHNSESEIVQKKLDERSKKVRPPPSLSDFIKEANVKMSATTSDQPKQFYRRVLPESCIAFGSAEGKAVFKDALLAGHLEGYFGLSAQFRTQDAPAYCGLSTLVMALNTLEVDPGRVWKGVWRWYHEDMLDCCVPLGVVARSGLTFEQFACLAACNTLRVETVRGGGLEAFREHVREVTTQTDTVLVVSYSRSVLGQTGDGHFSPLAGYDPSRDLALILDTARFKYPPHWVPVATLYDAMQKEDKQTGRPRGYFLLSKNQRLPLVMFRIAADISSHSSQQQVAARDRSDTYKTLITPMAEFLHTWTDWLHSASQSEPATQGNQSQPATQGDQSRPATQGDQSEPATQGDHSAPVLVAAVSRLLASLPSGETLLTTQPDAACPRSLSPEHSCVLRDIVSALENLPLFELVTQHLSAPGAEAVSAPRAGATQAGTKHGDGNTACPAADAPCPVSVSSLGPEHFLTMLLLSWPYPKCGSSHGHQVARDVVMQVACSGSLWLQDEVAQLRYQLECLLNYRRSCDSCHCRQ